MLKQLNQAVNATLVRAQIEVQHGKRRLVEVITHEEGQTMAEYVVMLVIVGLALAAVVALGNTIRDKFQLVNGQISGAY